VTAFYVLWLKEFSVGNGC